MSISLYFMSLSSILPLLLNFVNILVFMKNSIFLLFFDSFLISKAQFLRKSINHLNRVLNITTFLPESFAIRENGSIIYSRKSIYIYIYICIL